MKPSAAALFASIALCTSLGAAVAAEAAGAKPDIAKGQAASTVCQACHTANGSRGVPANPILQGQFAAYLGKQLHDFKDGSRKSAIMGGMAAPLSDDDIRNISAFYASKLAKPGFAKHEDSVALAEGIWRGGIAQRNIPACAGCHGPAGAGIPVQYPRLSGQHADYTEAQLIAFRDGTRGNSAVMHGVAQDLRAGEIKALADYIQGLR